MPADLGRASDGAGVEDTSPSFEGLLHSLSAVHEQQRAVIKRLYEENALLQERIQKSGGDPGNSLSSFHALGNVDNVKPQLPGDDYIVSCNSVRVKTEGQKSTSSNSAPEVALQASQARGGDGDRRNWHSEGGASTATSWPLPELWQEWAQEQPDEPLMVATKGTVHKIIVIEEKTGQAMTVGNQCYQQLIVRPDSMVRLTWDLLSSIMVLYDVMAIPLMAISLRKDELMAGGTGPFTDTMDWVTTIFWTVDVPWSFFTGYHGDGVVEMRATAIARHYLRTWFTFDFVLIAIDWTIVVLSRRGANAVGLFRMGKTVRMARILRSVRLLRFVKLQRVVIELIELVNSEYARACVSVTFAVAFIIVINHYLACGWFVVGHVGRLENIPNWIESNHVHTNTLSYAYFTSLHWSMTQFTPASMEIHPFNVYERIYAISCLLFALITFSSFLGSITASISQLRRHTTEIGKQQFVLRSYFVKNNVSRSLTKLIWRFLQQHHFSQISRSHKAQIEVLAILPTHLQEMLHQELYGPYITRAPFFYHYAAFAREGLLEVCRKGITEKTLIYGEVLFSWGKVAEKMYFPCSGFLKYDHQHIAHSLIGTGAWISEPVLWVKWVHAAEMIADTSAELIELDSAQFRAAMAKFNPSLPYVKVYAQLFHEYLATMVSTEYTDVITDVHVLEDLARDAWLRVTCSRDRSKFKEMRFLSNRQQRVQDLLWAGESQRISRSVARGWQRLSANFGHKASEAMPRTQ